MHKQSRGTKCRDVSSVLVSSTCAAAPQYGHVALRGPSVVRETPGEELHIGIHTAGTRHASFARLLVDVDEHGLHALRLGAHGHLHAVHVLVCVVRLRRDVTLKYHAVRRRRVAHEFGPARHVRHDVHVGMRVLVELLLRLPNLPLHGAVGRAGGPVRETACRTHVMARQWAARAPHPSSGCKSLYASNCARISAPCWLKMSRLTAQLSSTCHVRRRHTTPRGQCCSATATRSAAGLRARTLSARR